MTRATTAGARPTKRRPAGRPAGRPVGKLPTTGAEPTFSDEWYSAPLGKDSNNCYEFALGGRGTDRGYKMQPGDLAREPSDADASSCDVLLARALDDNRARGAVRVPPGRRCPAGRYKIAGMIDPGRDFHWMRQDGHVFYRMRPGDTLASVARDLGVPPSSIASPSSKPAPGTLVFVRDARTWSHKQGLATGPLLRDAAGRTIFDPRRADVDFGSLNYKKFCGTLCLRPAADATGPPEPALAAALPRLLASTRTTRRPTTWKPTTRRRRPTTRRRRGAP